MASDNPQINDPYILYDQNELLKDFDKRNDDIINKLFIAVRELQQKQGDMFLFGKITAEMLTLITLIYHENIARILQNETVPSPRQPVPSFMLGILELKNGKIYLTISEDPEEDPSFGDKLTALHYILINSGVVPTYLEHTLERYAGTNLTNYYPKLRGSKRFKVTDLIDNQLCDKMIVDQCKDAKTTTNYNGSAWPTGKNVNFINSDGYLEQRRQGVAFFPFKRYKKGNNNRKHETIFTCNNGSTCVEAKLFSYMYEELRVGFEQITGFASYWVGDKLPGKGNPMESYCYSAVSDDDKQLTNMTKNVLDMIRKGTPTQDMINKHKYILQPLALSCPGCLLNWENYRNNRKMNFNYGNCYTTLKSQTRKKDPLGP